MPANNGYMGYRSRYNVGTVRDPSGSLEGFNNTTPTGGMAAWKKSILGGLLGAGLGAGAGALSGNIGQGALLGGIGGSMLPYLLKLKQQQGINPTATERQQASEGFLANTQNLLLGPNTLTGQNALVKIPGINTGFDMLQANMDLNRGRMGNVGGNVPASRWFY